MYLPMIMSCRPESVRQRSWYKSRDSLYCKLGKKRHSVKLRSYPCGCHALPWGRKTPRINNWCILMFHPSPYSIFSCNFHVVVLNVFNFSSPGSPIPLVTTYHPFLPNFLFGTFLFTDVCLWSIPPYILSSLLHRSQR